MILEVYVGYLDLQGYFRRGIGILVPKVGSFMDSFGENLEFYGLEA